MLVQLCPDQVTIKGLRFSPCQAENLVALHKGRSGGYDIDRQRRQNKNVGETVSL
jgi:hypothetical protein